MKKTAYKIPKLNTKIFSLLLENPPDNQMKMYIFPGGILPDNQFDFKVIVERQIS